MRYLISFNPDKGFPSSCGSTDLNGAGSNLTEEPRTAGKAGWGGPNGPSPSLDRITIIKSDRDLTSNEQKGAN